MLNLGAGEITLLCLLAVIFLGPSKLSDLGQGLREIVRTRVGRPPTERFHLLLRRGSPRRWTTSDWLLVCAAIAAGAFALLTFVFSPR